MEGGIKLLSYPELARDADRLLPYIWESRNVQKLIQRASPEQTTIFIGKENQCEELQNSSAVITPFAIGNRSTGSIGIIGPIRMDYAAMVAETEYFGGVIRPDPDGLRRHGSRNGILCPAGGRTSHRDI